MTDLENYQPSPDENGEYSWSNAIPGLEQELGRELTPDEFGKLQDIILEQAIPASLTEQNLNQEFPNVHGLVYQLTQDHPDWSHDQIKNAVRRQFLDVMTA